MLLSRLSDGTALWLDPMRDVRSVALGVYVAAGSVDEAPEEEGATHFLEHLLFKRSKKRSGAAIARLTDRLGGDCDAYTTRESVAFHARVPADRTGEAVDLLLDLTSAPAFTAQDVEVERGVILEEMREANDVPEDRLHDAFLRQLWPEDPLGAPILGTEASVRALSRRDLASRFESIFRPKRTAIIAVGAFDPATLRDLIESWRARGRRESRPTSAFRPRRPGARRCALLLPRPELTQSHVLVGAATIPWGHPLVPAAWLATEILGGGVSSRLWRDVRERQGLAYHVGADLALYRDAGVALIEAATAPKNLARLVRTTGRVLRRIVESGVSRAELSRAKNQFRAEAVLALESTAARRQSLARAWLYRGRPYPIEEYLADVDRVTTGDVAEAVGRLFGRRAPLGLGVTGAVPEGLTLDDLRGELAA